MTSLLTAEVLKVTTAATTRRLLAGAATAAVLLAAASLAMAGIDGNAPLGSAGNLANVARLSGVPGYLLLVLGVLAMAGEYQHRTITSTFLVSPVRGRVLAAKLVVAAGVGVAVGVALVAVAAVVAACWYLVDGAAVDLADAEVVRAVGGSLVSGVLLAVLGVSIGALVRNQLAAVLAALGWLVVAEGVLSVVLGSGAVRWLPGGAVRAVQGGGGDLLPMWGAALLLALYALGVALAASRLTLRRDVA